MLVNLKPIFYLRLADLLERMGRDADAHEGLDDNDTIVEVWVPSDREDPAHEKYMEPIEAELTVGDLRSAKKLYQELRLGYEVQGTPDL